MSTVEKTQILIDKRLVMPIIIDMLREAAVEGLTDDKANVIRAVLDITYDVERGHLCSKADEDLEDQMEYCKSNVIKRRFAA